MFGNGMDKYVDYAAGVKKDAEPMPLWIVPNKKLTVADVERAMRDHYEGTPFALDGDIGGGIWDMPYRPTPLRFTVDGKNYFNERPISTQQTGSVYVSQMRSWLPNEIGGVLWYGNDDGNMVAFTPVYCCVDKAPKCYDTPNADGTHFSMDNAFWVCNWVSNMVYPRYSQMFDDLKYVRDSLDNSYFANQKAVEENAIALYKESPNKAKEYLKRYSYEKADEMMDAWRNLATYLIVKYNDMTIRPEHSRGNFKMTKEGLPERVQRPGFPENYKKKLLETTGDKFAIPAE